MAVLFTDPIDWISQFQQALDNFRTSGWLGSSPSGSGGYPPLNVFRKGDDLVLIAELPGIRKSDEDDVRKKDLPVSDIIRDLPCLVVTLPVV